MGGCLAGAAREDHPDPQQNAKSLESGGEAGISTERIPWMRVLAEGIVIIGSILLAFGIDAWWDRGQDRAQAESLLVSLLEDFDAAEASLNAVEAEHRELATNGQKLLEYGEVGRVPPDERENVDYLLGSHFLRPTFDPPMGTVESLLASGRLDLFDNELLVAGLTNWASAVASLRRTQLDARQHFYDQMYPYLADHIDLEDLDKGYAEYLGEIPFDQNQTEAHRLLEDRKLLNILYMHWVFSTNAAEIEIPRVRAALQEIRAQTEIEIGDREP